MVSADLTSGARFEVTKASSPDDVATYRLLVALPDERAFAGEVVLRVDGDVPEPELAPRDGSSDTVPEWTTRYLKTLLRQALRTRGTSGRWPRRYRQWRAAPGEGSA